MTLKVSDDKRYLVQEDGSPFFWLGDTAWELFHRLNREEADRYLETRARQGFTVIQAVVLAELDGLHDPNPYGDKPLDADDPTRPNEAYFQHVDYVVRKAESLGLIVGMLPTWGDKWNKKWGGGPEVFTPENARAYGEWLARRYKDASLVWVLGGDRPVDTDAHRDIIRAMAEGVRAGDEGRHLITFHPCGGQTSSTPFHEEPWLDFNMWQTGHGLDTQVSDLIQSDRDKTPTKPVLDGEPLYEDHPLGFNRDKNGTSLAADVRKSLWWDLLGGACGYTYGNHSVWQMYASGRAPINGPIYFWYDALERPGANQMRHARALLMSRPQATRIPDADLVTSDKGAGGKRIVAARDRDGSYALVYTPASRPFTLDTTHLSGDRFNAFWFDPRLGQSTPCGELARADDNRLTFTPPNEGENQDWVLVLDDASRNFPAPGATGVR